MDKNLYNIMQNLKNNKSTEITQDIRYIGTISMNKKTSNGNVRITKDVIAIIDISSDKKMTIKYYDENQELIAGRGNDGRRASNPKYMYDDLDFLSQLDSLDLKSAISLEELDNELNEVSKILGVSKSEIDSMSKVKLDTIKKEKNADESTIDSLLESNKQHEDELDHDQDAFDGISAKQTIDLDTKVTDKLTIADVLGVQAGSELIVVPSSAMENNPSSTRYSCIIKSPDRKYERAHMLHQVGGKDSDKNIYATNRDGSKIEQKVAQSSFSIDSPIVKNGVISIMQGDTNRPNVFYGEMDPTSPNDVFAQPLETREMYPVTRKVRDEFSQRKGTYNISNKMDEIQEHEEKGCKNLSLDEADGNRLTGHNHSKDAAQIILEDENVGHIIDDVYTFDEVKERFDSMQKQHPDSSFDELIESTKADLVSDAEHQHSNERRF